MDMIEGTSIFASWKEDLAESFWTLDYRLRFSSRCRSYKAKGRCINKQKCAFSGVGKETDSVIFKQEKENIIPG